MVVAVAVAVCLVTSARSMTKHQFMQFVQDAITVDYSDDEVEETFIEMLLPGSSSLSTESALACRCPPLILAS